MASFENDSDVYSPHSEKAEDSKALHAYQILIEKATDIFFVISAQDNQFTYINNAVETILGYSIREAITLRPTSLISEASAVTVGDILRRAIADNSELNTSIVIPNRQVQVLAKNGSFKNLDISMVMTLADDHTVEKITGIAKAMYIVQPEKEMRETGENGTDDNKRTRTGSILIMDDEDIILDISSQMCKRMGLEVATTRNGEEAIKLYRERFRQGEPFDAVFLDMTIAGGLGGIDAAAKLKEIDPEVRTVVMSGYSDHEVMSDPDKYGFYAVLVKPFRLNDFSALIKEMLPEKFS